MEGGASMEVSGARVSVCWGTGNGSTLQVGTSSANASRLTPSVGSTSIASASPPSPPPPDLPSTRLRSRSARSRSLSWLIIAFIFFARRLTFLLYPGFLNGRGRCMYDSCSAREGRWGVADPSEDPAAAVAPTPPTPPPGPPGPAPAPPPALPPTPPPPPSFLLLEPLGGLLRARISALRDVRAHTHTHVHATGKTTHIFWGGMTMSQRV